MTRRAALQPSLPARHSSKHAPQQAAHGGEVTLGNVRGEKRQVDVVGGQQTIGCVIEALFRAAVFGFVEGQSLEIVYIVAEPLARLEKKLGGKVIVEFS